MSKMNGPKRKKLYQLLVKRDGEFCKFCKITPDKKQLVVEHIDNDNSNNILENLQLLCRRCNYIKNPRRPVVCESERGDEEQDLTELQVSRTKKPQFKRYVAHQINEKEQVPERHLVNGGAEAIGLSSVTTKRYMNEMCSPDGLYDRKKIGNTAIIEYKADLSFR